ncbi:MAG: TusE/DsrC/DsvC family sulfur relay protein [Deltaproteobacteria bacterium]|nr:MAG: TusE/DsrC/DsvC family sulfur relay protein [Deltaproteobacteria bacterium]
MDAELKARLDAIDAKLDYIVARQEYTEDFIREMTPVAREAMNAMAAKLSTWEERGYFAIAGELGGLLDKLSEAYGPEDVHELSGSIVAILDTARNLTQPDMLELANEAGDVLHDAENVKPVGPFSAMSAARDADVQRGMGVALELLRHLGRAQGSKARPEVRRPAPKAQASAAPMSEDDVPAVCPVPTPAPTPPADEIVEWEGHRFNGEGFLLDPSAWNEELAAKMAGGLGLELTGEHWQVLKYARQDYLATGSSPNVRRIASGSGVGIRRMYELFPKTPGKSAAMVAGIPKPAGCV